MSGTSQRYKTRSILALALMAILVAPPRVRGDEEFITIPLLIKVLKGAKVGKPAENVTAEQQATRIKKIHERLTEIYAKPNDDKKSAQIEFTLPDKDGVKTDVEIPDVPATADPNKQQRTKIRDWAKAELKTAFGAGQGMMVVFAKQPMKENNNAEGVCHVLLDEDDKIVEGAPVGLLRWYKLAVDEADGLKNTGDTVAHEFGHSMGLGHNTDDKYVMWKDDLRRDVKFSNTEIATMRKIAATRGKAKKKDAKDQPAEPKPKSSGMSFDPGKTNPAAPEFQNVWSASMFADAASPTFDVTMVLNDVIPAAGSGTYQLLLDSDNNAASGVNVLGFDGIDHVVRVDVHSSGVVDFTLDDPEHGTSTPVPGALTHMAELLDYLDPSNGDTLQSGFELSVPKSLLGLTGGRFHDVIVVASDSSLVMDLFHMTLDTSAELAGPQLSTTAGLVSPLTQSFLLEGTGYSPDSPVDLFLGETFVATVQSDSTGAFSTALTLPTCAAFDHVFIYAKDTQSSDYGFTVVNVVATACDTNCDGSVNVFDVGPFIDLLNPNPPAGCSVCAGDTNGDGSVNAFDIQRFVDVLATP